MKSIRAADVYVDSSSKGHGIYPNAFSALLPIASRDAFYRLVELAAEGRTTSS